MAIAGAGGYANAALSYEMQRWMEGTIEADHLYYTAGYKGQVKGGGAEPFLNACRVSVAAT